MTEDTILKLDKTTNIENRNKVGAIHVSRCELGLLSEIEKEYEITSFDKVEEWVSLHPSTLSQIIVLSVDSSTEGMIHPLSKIRHRLDWADVPIVVIGPPDQKVALSCYDLGATLYRERPVNGLLLAKDIQVHLANYAQQKQAAEQVSMMMSELTEQLIHSERLATLGTLSASVAHEINNPSAFISSNVQTLERFWVLVHPVLSASISGHPEEERLKFVLNETSKSYSRIRDGVRRISKIVDHLKSFSHWKRGDQKSVDLNACIDQALLLMSSVNENRLKVIRDVPDNLPPLEGDMQQLTQVLTNLLTNAIHAMENTHESPTLTLSAREQDKSIFVVIEDNGSGICPEDLTRIWDPFFTTKDHLKGTGLGLSICKKIIESHGGSIHIKNKPDRGTQCIIRIPMTKERIS